MSEAGGETTIATGLGPMSSTDVEAIAAYIADELETLERVQLAVRCAANEPNHVARAITHDVESTVLDIICNRFDEGGNREEYGAAMHRWYPAEANPGQRTKAMDEALERIVTVLRERLGIDETAK